MSSRIGGRVSLKTYNRLAAAMTSERSYTLGEIADRFGGEVVGDASIIIRRVAPIESAGEGDIAFLARGAYAEHLASTRASALILPPAYRGDTRLARIVCADPYAYFARVSQLLNPPPEVVPGVHRLSAVDATASVSGGARVDAFAVIEAGAEIGDQAWIGANAFVGRGAVVGEGARLYPGAVVHHGCTLGKRTIVHSAAVIGADGFGFAPEGGRWIKIPQVGAVRIGDDCEIGAGTTIDRGAMSDTVIEDGVKLDNQIQVGHNCRIGAHTVVAGCVGISGSVQIGAHCMIGGGATFVGHIQIADHVQVSGGTLIMKSITKPGKYTGVYPFDTHDAWLRNGASVRHLDDMVRRLRAIEATLRDKQRNKA